MSFVELAEFAILAEALRRRSAASIASTVSGWSTYAGHDIAPLSAYRRTALTASRLLAMPQAEFAELTCQPKWVQEWSDSTGAHWVRDVHGNDALPPLQFLSVVSAEGWELVAVTSMNHMTRVYTLTRRAGNPPTIPPQMRRETAA